MKLGLQLGYWGAQPPANAAELVAAAEEAGFDAIFTAEAWGSDAFTPLAWWGRETSRVRLGTSIVQMSGRTPTSIAMHALNALPERNRAAGEQAIDRHSQRKYLGTLIRRLFSEQLGRHVAGGAAQTIVVGLVDAGQVSEAEVEQFDLTTGKQKNFLRLEVAVNDLQCRQILHRRSKF